MVRLATTAAWLSALLAGIATASDSPQEDIITERSPAPGKASEAINDALTKAGFDAAEAAKISDAYRVGADELVDQIDDSGDKSRQLLDDALVKGLDTADVEKVDDALNVLVGKLGGLVGRDVDATIDSGLVSRDVDATADGSLEGTRSSSVDDRNDITAFQSLEKRKSFPFPFEPPKCDCEDVMDAMVEPRPKPLTWDWYYDWKQEHWTDKKPNLRCVMVCVREATDRLTMQKIEKFNKDLVWFEAHAEATKGGDASDIPDSPPQKREETAEHSEQGAEESKMSEAQLESTKTSSEASRVNDGVKYDVYDPRAHEMWREIKEELRKFDPEKIKDLDEEDLRLSEQYTKIWKDIAKIRPYPVWKDPAHNPGSPGDQKHHSRRIAPELPQCDCKTVIDAVKEPKPEGGMTFEWYLNWQHKNLNIACVRPCVSEAVDRFAWKLKEFQLTEANGDFRKGGWPRTEDLPPHTKREEATDDAGPKDAKIPIPITKNEPPKSVHDPSYRAWYEATRKNNDFCTCELKKPTVWRWFNKLFLPSSRCSRFCNASVKAWFEKEGGGVNRDLPPRLPKNSNPADDSGPNEENHPGRDA